MPPDDVARRLAAVRSSTGRFLDALGRLGLDDDGVRASSLCPTWSRGHVLTHLARNADGLARTLGGALTGTPTPMYPGGDIERDADIEAGARRPFPELLEDVVTAAGRLDEVWAAMTPAAWDTDVGTRQGSQVAWRTLTARWREIEVHWVDLDIGYRPSDWPAAFVAPLLPSLADPDRLVPRLPSGVSVDIEVTDTGHFYSVTNGPHRVGVRGPSWALVGWLLGRAAAVPGELEEPPALKPWL